jgi:hypothetical protein
MKNNRPAKLRDRRTGKSPYQRRKKKPYAFRHKNCEHKQKVIEHQANARITACMLCGSILDRRDFETQTSRVFQRKYDNEDSSTRHP